MLISIKAIKIQENASYSAFYLQEVCFYRMGLGTSTVREGPPMRGQYLEGTGPMRDLLSAVLAVVRELVVILAFLLLVM